MKYRTTGPDVARDARRMAACCVVVPSPARLQAMEALYCLAAILDPPRFTNTPKEARHVADDTAAHDRG